MFSMLKNFGRPETVETVLPENGFRGFRDSLGVSVVEVQMALALHAPNASLIPGTSNLPLSPLRTIPQRRARSKP